MSTGVFIAFTTFPSSDLAGSVTRTLVEEQLIACGNILPAVNSVYTWDGSIQSTQEVQVIFKLSAKAFDAFMNRLKELHPYEVPEIIAIPVECGLPDYLDWVKTSVPKALQ